jgi:cell division protease FtsH
MKKQQKTLALWMVIIGMMILVMKVVEQKGTRAKQLTYSQFVKAVESGHVNEAILQGEYGIKGKFVDGYENGQYFELTGATGTETYNLLRNNNVDINYQKEEKQGLLSTIFINWFPMILLFVIFYFFLRQLQAGGGKAMSFGKSKAKMLNENEKKVTFRDVSGVEEAKEELVEVVDFLKEPKKIYCFRWKNS